MTNLVINVPGEYVSLGLVMQSALEQASKGKGKERHASEGEAYEDQIICEVARRVGLGYPLGQAVKKIYESQRIGGDAGVQELLGALNYVAAAVIVMREGLESVPKAEGNHPENPDSSPEFRPGDRVQFRDEIPSTSERIWVDAEYVRHLPDGRGHIVQDEKRGSILVGDKDVRPEPKAEGCEALVEKDAPQTPAELYDKIIASNPATYGRPRTPTGEELAEMAEEEPHG